MIFQANSLDIIISAAKKISSLPNNKNLYNEFLNIIESLIEVNKHFFYIIEKKHFYTIKKDSTTSSKLKSNDTLPELVKLAISEMKINFNKKKINTDEPIIACPIILNINNKDTVIAVYTIYDLEFTSYTETKINLIEQIISWLSVEICNKENETKKQKISILDINLNIFSYSYFMLLLKEFFTISKTYSLPLHVLKLKLNFLNTFSVRAKTNATSLIIESIKQNLRSIDNLCLSDKENEYLIIIPIAPDEYTNNLLNTINEHIKTMMVPCSVHMQTIKFSPVFSSEFEMMDKCNNE